MPLASGQLLVWLWPCCGLVQSLVPALSTDRGEHFPEDGGVGMASMGKKPWE